MNKFLLFGGLLSALAFPTTSVLAHEADCPFCGQAVTQDTPAQDNEVALKFGRKRIEYKCVFCALAEAHSEYKGDLSIIAPSEKKGEPVLIKREADKWTLAPASAVFVLNEPLKHKLCQAQARAYSTREAAQSFVDANKETLPNAAILTLDEMVKAASGENDAHAQHAAK